ncbi:MAG: drug/metabolite transporter (DMT)-like permease [Parasphingorhabdus sp.]|jgi:drug/metabolite transporter (DMT)-like permease
MTTHLRGILYCIGSGVFLAVNDAISKWLVPHYPTGQILFITCLGVAFLVWIITLCKSEIRITVNSWQTHLSRGLLFSVSSFAFITGLKFLPLAEAMCIAFASPLFVTLLGRFILKEHVGIYRLSAVIVGFIGIVIVMQPGSPSFTWIVLFPLTVAMSDACRDVLTRKMTASESSISMVFTTALTLAGISLLTLQSGWVPIQMNDLWLFMFKTIMMLIAYFLIIQAYRNAPTVVIAPFRYIQIAWGVLLGVALWGDIPDMAMYIGLALTIGSGIFIAIRESRLQPSSSN